MKLKLWRGVVATVLLAGALTVQAQMPGGSGMSGAMMKLFGDVKGFSAKAQMQMLDEGGKETMTMTMDSAFSNGNMRMDIDMTQIKSAQMPPQAVAMMQQMKMDKIVTLVLADKKTMSMIYPGMEAYVEMPMPAEEAKAAETKFKMDIKELGKEKIDGHACVKNQVTMTDDAGKKFEALTWNADDLQKFPVKTQFKEKGMTLVTIYKDVKLSVPDAKRFEAPAGFKKYGTQQELMMAVQQKMLGGAPGK